MANLTRMRAADWRNETSKVALTLAVVRSRIDAGSAEDLRHATVLVQQSIDALVYLSEVPLC
jgi:hypothetical protein